MFPWQCNTAAGSGIYLNHSASGCDEWMHSLADIVALSGSEWCCSTSVCLSAFFSVQAGLIESIHDELWACQSKRLSGADVPVKQLELTPATHQLSLLIKMEIVNICGELIRLPGLSVPFIWVPSLKLAFLLTNAFSRRSLYCAYAPYGASYF